VKIVLDTNVLVSGLLTPLGNCGEIVRMLTSDEITLCVDSRILMEYDEVLNRPQFHIAPQKAAVVIDYIQISAETHATAPLDKALPDENDNPFMEVALSSDAECLVTGNLKHFPECCREGVTVLAPKEFLEFFRKHRIIRH
jgi:putative PIN family toxin of toxin-antitoxin system